MDTRSRLGLVLFFSSLGALGAACGSSDGAGPGDAPGDDASVDGGDRQVDGGPRIDAAPRDDGAAPSNDGASTQDDGASAHDATPPSDDASTDAAPPKDGAPPDDGSPPDDAAPPPPDAATPDTGAVDASAGGDAGPVACGATWCRDGESCSSGVCVLASCNGVTVAPGLQTLQNAVNALAPLGGTICLAAGDYDGVEVSQGDKPLAILGLSPALTHLTGILIKGGADVTLAGVSNSGNSDIGLAAKRVLLSNTSLTQLGITTAFGNQIVVQSSTIVAPNTSSATVQIVGGDGGGTVLLDALDIAGGNGKNVGVYFTDSTTNGATSVTLQNSYVHDAYRGVLYLYQGPSPHEASITLLNDTFTSDAVGVLTMPHQGHLTLTYFNDVFYGDPVAIEIDGTSAATTVAHGNQALFANGANFAGVAVAGPGYVTSDPKLDRTTTPPSLGAGSPCLGAGDRAHAPATDYWRRSRAARVDIGAVQGL